MSASKYQRLITPPCVNKPGNRVTISNELEIDEELFLMHLMSQSRVGKARGNVQVKPGELGIGMTTKLNEDYR